MAEIFVKNMAFTNTRRQAIIMSMNAQHNNFLSEILVKEKRSVSALISEKNKFFIGIHRTLVGRILKSSEMVEFLNALLYLSI